MEHQVTIESQVEIPEVINEESILALVTHVLHSEGVQDSWLIGIQFVDDPSMQAAHVAFMDIDQPTDIMTFPYADDDDVWGEIQAGGDLIISVDRARSHAHYAGWAQEDEIFFLIAHGLLHLLGWDDASNSERERMLNRQKELLDTWEERP